MRFSGIVDTMSLTVTTPITARAVHHPVQLPVQVDGRRGDPRNVGQAFVREVDKQFLEDKPIWEHKAHLVRPGPRRQRRPFMKFRKWARSSTPRASATSARCSRRRGGPTVPTRRPPRPPPARGTATRADACSGPRFARHALGKCLRRRGEAGRLRPAADLAILVDPAMWPWRDRLWAHLVSDESYDELHAFAERLGIPRRPSRATTTTCPRTTASEPSSSAPTPSAAGS